MKRVNVESPNPETMNKHDNVFEQLEQNAEYAQQQIEQSEASTAALGTLEERVIAALKEIYDPEIPINIYDLGLIYRVEIDGNKVAIDMTLTTPGCPVAQSFPGMVENTVSKVPGIDVARVELVWDPPWTQENLSDAARLQLGLM